MNKYKNKWCVCMSGHRHRSTKEGNYCNSLNLFQKIGAIKDYKTQVTYELKVNGYLICKHIIDFEVINNDGIKEIHEIKGKETRDFKLKYKLFKALYPDIKYKIIK